MFSEKKIWKLLRQCCCLALLSAALFQIFSAQADAPIKVVDDAGRTVALARPAQRIVSLAPHITEMLFSAGAGERIVGTVDFSNYPVAARHIPRIGSSQHLDFERITALQPDLVIGWKSGNPQAALDHLDKLGFALFLSEPRTMTDIADGVETLARLTATEAVAHSAVQPFRDGLQKLALRHRNASPVSVFYEIWNKPLMTLNGEHIVSDVLALCGGHNVFAELSNLAPTVSIEAVLEKNPQAIIASGSNDEPPLWLDEWQQWPHLQSVENGHVFFIPPDIIQRHSLRLLQGAEMLCAQLEQVRQAPAP